MLRLDADYENCHGFIRFLFFSFLAAGADLFRVSVSISPVSDGYVLNLYNDYSEGLKIAPFYLGGQMVFCFMLMILRLRSCFRLFP